jgi:hypothetical protein
MDIFDLFNLDTEPIQPYKMDKNEFFVRTKKLLENLSNNFSQSFFNRYLMDFEYPEESICDKCTGCGTFIYDGEEKECYQDREHGECLHRLCDYEQIGMYLEDNIVELCELLSVDEIVDIKNNDNN